MDPADQVEAVENSSYPIYDASNPEHNPQASVTPFVHGHDPAPAAPISWLDTIAQKLRAATELLHTTRSSSPERKHEAGKGELPKAQTVRARSRSPKKSVRFRSQTFSGGSAPTSSPINVLTKMAPSLPALRIPSNDIMRHITSSSDQDPILTGRPEDTPYLKRVTANEYFFPFPSEIDNKLDELKARSTGNQLHVDASTPPSLLQDKSDSGNPFDDSAAIFQHPSSSLEDVAKASVPDEQPVKPAENGTRGQPGSESSENTDCSGSSATLTSRDQGKESSESSAPPLVVDKVGGPSTSPWDLQSRRPETCGGVDLGTDTESDDSEQSVRRRLQRKPRFEGTHEEIRRKFRVRGGRRRGSHGRPPGCSTDAERGSARCATPTSPMRSPGRAFRFSNNSPQGKTPSPASVPLPLLIPPKRRAPHAMTWRDQYGWTPFDEPLFPKKFAEAFQDDKHDKMLEHGGFADFWEICSLPTETKPAADTKALTLSDLQSLTADCFAALERDELENDIVTPGARCSSTTPPKVFELENDIVTPGARCSSTTPSHALPTLRRLRDLTNASSNTDGIESTSELSI